MAETIANPESLTLGKALGQASKLIRLLEEAGLSQEALQEPIDNPDCRRKLVMAWENLVHPVRGEAGSCTLAEAAQIMGDNFHGPAAVKKHLGIKLGPAKQWRSVPFSALELAERKFSHVLVAVPAVSIMDLHQRVPQVFYSQRNPWYGEAAQRDAFSGRPAEAGWYLVRKDELPDSTSTDWSVQRSMNQPPDFVPAANLVVCAWVLHYLDSGERMFSRIWVRIDSQAAVGVHVRLRGRAYGLIVYYGVDDAGSAVGVASARKSG